MDTPETPAYCDGWLAHKNDVGIEENPYDELRQPFSNLQWMRGWCDRFSAIKHGRIAEFDWRDREWGLA